MRIRIIGAVLALLLAGIGTAFLVSYVSSADRRAYDGAELVDAYFVSKEIPAGTPGDSLKEYLELRRLPKAALADDRVENLSDLTGKVASIDLLPGEQLVNARWVSSADFDGTGSLPIPDGYQAFTIALPVERVVGGTIQPGSTVGITVTSGSQSRMLLHKVLVLAVASGTSYVPQTTTADGTTSTTAAEPVSTVMVTFALTTPQIEVIAWGQDFGKLWLSREPAAADETGGRKVDQQAIFG